MDTLFIEIAIVIIAAGVLSLVFTMLKQPMIIAYIVTGLLVGPSILGFAGDINAFQAMSEIGIAFLLFLVGLNLNWRNIKDVGKIALLGGLGQVAFTTFFGSLIAFAFGFDLTTSILIGIAFAFSSTIIIVKLLTDKEDLDRFYGRIAVGMLIVQDLVAMVVLLVIGAMTGSGAVEVVLLVSGLKAVVVIGGLWLMAKYVLPHIFEYVARSQELLFLIALSWCFAIAAGLYFLGFGIEIGALLAGLTLAGSQFHREIESKIRPLRDFFLIIFFIVLGTHLSLDSLSDVLLPSLAFSAFILIGNPLIVLAIFRASGYHPRTGFMVGATMAQVSEFSFILLAVASSTGLIDDSILPMATIVGLVTIGMSTYLINYSEIIYQKLEWVFRWMEKKPELEQRHLEDAPEILLIGYDHLGKAILPSVKKLKKSYLVIDFDPVVIKVLEDSKVSFEYGDAGNEEFLHHILAEKSKMIISTVPDFAVNSDLVEYIKQKRSRSAVIVTAKNPHQANKLYKLGATFVILPNMLGGELFSQLLSKKKEKKQSWVAVRKKQEKLFKEY